LQVTADLVMDAHLAALAIEHKARLATTDRDFARFRGLKFLDPDSRSNLKNPGRNYKIDGSFFYNSIIFLQL